MARNDFLRPLRLLHPVVVAGLVWATGWGTLLLIAWRTDTITAEFLRSPGHMIGDLVLLPAGGFLIASFYRRTAEPPPSVGSGRITYAAVALASLVTVTTTVYSIGVSGNYQGLWSVPHTVFIWMIAYVLISYFFRGLGRLLSRPARSLWLNYLGVTAVVSTHIALKLALG